MIKISFTEHSEASEHKKDYINHSVPLWLHIAMKTGLQTDNLNSTLNAYLGILLLHIMWVTLHRNVINTFNQLKELHVWV